MSAGSWQNDYYEQLAAAPSSQVNPIAASLLETLDDPRWDGGRAALLDDLQLYPGALVLEAGCGPGMLLEGIAERVGPDTQVWGLDLNPHFIEIATRRARMLGLDDARFMAADCHAMPFQDGAFDAVVAERLLMHVGPVGRVVREFARVLSEGGRLVVSDYDPYTCFAAGPDPTLTARVLASAASVYASPQAARETAKACVDAGLYVEQVRGQLLVIEDPQLPTAAGIAQAWADHATHGRLVERGTVQRWLHAVQRAGREGRFLLSLPHIVTIATKVR